MAAPDPAVVERQFYLSLLNITDDGTLTLAELRSLTGGGAFSASAVQAANYTNVQGLGVSYQEYTAVGGAITLSGKKSTHYLALVADTTVTLSDPIAGQTISIWATGSFNLTVAGVPVATKECVATYIHGAWQVRIIGGSNVPEQPGTITVTPTNDGYVLTWLAAPSGVPVTNYDVQLDGGAWVDSGSDLTHTFTGLAPSSSHSGAVRARTGGGVIGPSRSWGPAFVNAYTPTYVDEVTADGPTYFWPFDTNGNTSIGSKNVTLAGTAAIGAPIGSGTGALSLPVGTDTATAAYDTGLDAATSWTMECIMKLNTTQGAGLNWNIMKNGNAISLNLYNQTQFAVASIGVMGTYAPGWTNGRLVHLAITWSGTVTTIYVNGVSVGTSSAKSTPFTGSGSFAFGGDGFIGQIDGAAVYVNKCLTAARLLAHKTAAGL